MTKVPNNKIIYELVKDKSPLVTRHNCMIEANYKLSLQEQRIILWLASQIKPEDTEFEEQIIKISDLCSKVGIKSKNMYKEMEQITKNIIQNVLQIYSLENNSLLQIPWLSYAEYLYEDRAVKLCLSSRLKPYLLELKERFTSVDLEVLISFRGIYSLRLYELMKQYQKIGTRIITLKDLRNRFVIEKNEYVLYGHFKERIIEKAQKEINEKSDIRFDFEEIKEGRRVVAIKFFISSKEQEDGKELLVRANNVGIGKLALNNLLCSYNISEICHGITVLENHKGLAIKNPVQFLKKALIEGWQPFVEEGVKSRTPVILDAGDECEMVRNIRERMAERIGESDYKAWLEQASMFLEDDRLIIQVKNKFVGDWIETHYKHVIREITERIEGVEVRVKNIMEGEDIDYKVKEISVINGSLTESPGKKNSRGEPVKKQKKTKKAAEEEKQVLPVLKQLTLWERLKQFLPGA